MKKFIHALILAVFGISCWFIWAMLTLTSHFHRANPNLPGFTYFCIGCRPVVMALPILATVYCLWVWFRKADRVPSWMGFFAATMGVLVMMALPAMIAAYLPLLSAVGNLPSK